MDERGTSGFWAAQVAAWDSRDRKEHFDLVRLRESGAPGPPSTVSDASSSTPSCTACLGRTDLGECSRSHAACSAPLGLPSARPRSPIPIS